MKRIVLLLITCMFAATATNAQSWQWAKRMGGAVTTRPFGTYGGNPTDEHVLDVATDAKGNTYLLYSDWDSLINVDGHALAGYGKMDIILSSFTCDGAYRWSKVMGTSEDFDRGVAVKTDGAGGVYVCGYFPQLASAPGHIAADTTISGTGRTMFLTKWDTGGAFKWLRMPQPDTMSRYSADTLSALIDMDVDGQGCHLLAYLTPGAYAGGRFIVATKGTYVLRYGPGGVFIGGTALPFSIPNFLRTPIGSPRRTHLTYNASRNRYIITSEGLYTGTVVGGTAIPDGAFVATFDATSGAIGFLKTNTAGVPLRIPGRAKTDAQDNIYIAGTAYNNTTFNGTTFSYPQQFACAFPFAMKMDAATGNAIWTQSGHGTNWNQAAACAIAVAGNRVLLGGSFADKVVFPTDSFSNAYLINGDDCFIMQLDAGTGAVQHTATFGMLGATSAPGPSLMDILFKIATDTRGNFYVVGTFNDYLLSNNAHTITIGGTTLQTAGWADAYVAKLGWANCNCTPPAAPAFTASKPSGKSVRLTYTSAPAGLDSLVWDFGDGQRLKITSGYATQIIHNYTADGHYNVCVTAYAETCGGSQTYCVQTALAVGSFSASGDVKVYPNPAGDNLTIEGAEGSIATIMSSVGQQVVHLTVSSIKELVNISRLPSGIYLLSLEDKQGIKRVVRFTKA